MSNITNLILNAWLERLNDEGLLLRANADHDDGAHAAHLEGFVRAIALSEGFDERQVNRLRTITNELLDIYEAFKAPIAQLFFGEHVLEQCIEGLYGPTVGTAMAADRRQRRILIESVHLYEAECLGQLLLTALSDTTGSQFHVSSWQEAYDDNHLKSVDGPQALGERAYDRQRSAKYRLLSQPGALHTDSIDSLLVGFPNSVRAYMGFAQVLLTTSTPESKPIQRNEFRQTIGSHGIIRVKSLNEILNQGTPLLPILDGITDSLTHLALTDPIMRQLAARLEGYQWLCGRQTLVCLLNILDARGILSHFNDAALERAITDLEQTGQESASSSVHDGLDAHLAEGFLKGRNLPELLNDFERQAYVYAARVSAVKRPGQNIRVQDLAIVLKTPRQTVSRKWHAFQISADEYQLNT